MTSTIKNTGLKFVEKRTELYAPHRGGRTTFLHPHYGPNTYAHVASTIEQDGLAAPTLSETISLVHAAFHSNDKYSMEIRKLMNDQWLWGFTGIHYIPLEGAYIEPHPRIKNGMPFMEKDDLVRRLEAHDPAVRFVPFGFRTGEMPPLELAKNPFIQALAEGEEGAEKLAEIADYHRNKPCLWSFESVDEPTTRVSALHSNWVGVRRLDVNRSDLGSNWGGCAFGVRK